jgi:hypothetical protein
MGKRNNKNNQQQNPSGGSEKHPPSLLIIVALIGAIATIIAALIAALFGPIILENRHLSATQTADAILRNISLTQTPTLPPFGDNVFEIDFSTNGEGNCNNYDPKVLGYDTNLKVYYIVPDKGYVAVCHKNDNLRPEGILQTTAFPEGKPSYFGYVAFFGWQGDTKITTDACGFGVRRNDSITEAVFVQIIGGKWKTTPIELKNFELDTTPHSIRMILYPSGKAIGYLDGNYAAEHSFVDCKSGPVGLIAYGPGQVRINFTSLKLFALHQ